MRSLELRVVVEEWPRRKPLRITGYTFECVRVVVVHLVKDGYEGRGEAAGAYYKNESAESMVRQVEDVRSDIEAGLDRHGLQDLLPSGGARNAVDCALWDLESKRTGRPVWQLAGLDAPRALLTTFTCGADEPEHMASTARGFIGSRALKLKLTGESIDADRVRAVRAARPDVWLGVDANQGFTPSSLGRLMPVLVEGRVSLIEQPFRIDQDDLLDGFGSPIAIAADESVQDLESVRALVGRFDMINIKLDKCGGLTQGLAMARTARSRGLDVMVGCMGGTSLAMAPAFLLGQLCDVVDLDGPAFIRGDRADPVSYAKGLIDIPQSLWGYPRP
jgi:L-alanine-DL-glutamate epimerase-like enolase superfamily enzyme